MRPLYVAIGVDCDPDRDAYPSRLTWHGIEQLPRLFDLAGVRWTFNVRADTQIRDRSGSAGYCYERYHDFWSAARHHGSEIAWHLHYFDAQGRQNPSEANVLENIRLGAEALGHPEVVHMGWTFQSEFSIRHLREAGVRVDYSPAPRMRFGGRGRVDAYDWWTFPYRPTVWHGVRMIPTFTFQHRLLSRRFRTERVMLTTTTSPPLYKLLLRDFFRTGQDFFVTYFHADELVPALGDWRDRLYAFEHLRANLYRLAELAGRNDYQVRYVTVGELAEILFRERRALPDGDDGGGQWMAEAGRAGPPALGGDRRGPA